MQDSLVSLLSAAPLVPTAFPQSADALCTFARALHAEGYPALELLARPQESMLEVWRQIIDRPERRLILWGAGTIKTATAAREVVELRPNFLVSPAFSRRVLEVAVANNIPYIPGVHSFQDVQDVIDAFDEHGLEVNVLKLCPVYGLTSEYVASLCGCFPGIQFCPTGEIDWDNYQFWKRQPGIIAPMGSRMFPREFIAASDEPVIRARLKKLRGLAKPLLPQIPTSNRGDNTPFASDPGTRIELDGISVTASYPVREPPTRRATI